MYQLKKVLNSTHSLRKRALNIETIISSSIYHFFFLLGWNLLGFSNKLPSTHHYWLLKVLFTVLFQLVFDLVFVNMNAIIMLNILSSDSCAKKNLIQFHTESYEPTKNFIDTYKERKVDKTKTHSDYLHARF